MTLVLIRRIYPKNKLIRRNWYPVKHSTEMTFTYEVLSGPGPFLTMKYLWWAILWISPQGHRDLIIIKMHSLDWQKERGRGDSQLKTSRLFKQLRCWDKFSRGFNFGNLLWSEFSRYKILDFARIYFHEFTSNVNFGYFLTPALIQHLECRKYFAQIREIDFIRGTLISNHVN